MNNSLVKTTINVKNTNVGVMRVGNVDYISLTDLARYANPEFPADIIKSWIRNKQTIIFLGAWEEISNPDFKLVEFDQFEKESGKNTFMMSPRKWVLSTNAIGIISKSGNNGGTYAHPDIAFEFASWIDPVFKIYLIKEFERLKKNEMYQEKVEWKANRVLSKVNYLIHTDAISKNIIPNLTDKQKRFIYADEADVLNVALFGMTAKEWRDKNKELSKTGNIRDYTDILHLIILSNLENINASMIKDNMPQRERLIKLNELARNQLALLINNKNIEKLEQFEVNNS